MPVNKQIRVLLIDANSEDAQKIEEILLSSNQCDFVCDQVAGFAEGLSRLQAQTFDVALLDLALPDGKGQVMGCNAITRLQACAPGLPIVVMNREADEQVTLSATQYGIHDYIIKDEHDKTHITRTIRFAVQKKQVLQLVANPQHDPLTGLANRTLFQDRMEQAISRSERDRELLALFYIELDRFKYVTESFGDETRDAAVLKTASLIGACMRKTDTLAYLGNGRFGVLLENIKGIANTVSIAEKLIANLSRRRNLHTHRIKLNASIGIAFYPECSSISELHNAAEQVLLRARRAGGNRYKIFTDNMSQESIWKYRLDMDLLSALKNDEFRLHYQPVINLQTGTAIKVEALLRWQHPEGGLIYPDAFIDHLESLEIMRDVGEWVLALACRQLKSWRSMGLDLCMDVNVSREQLSDPGFVDRVKAILKSTEILPAYLELELTERQHIPEHDQISHTNIQKLVDMGIRFAIDDYGTGHNSDLYLRRFPAGTFSTLKIDQSYVKNITENPTDAACVKRDTDFAHELGLQVIAEGIETKSQLKQVRSIGADAVQGYLISRPLAAPQIADGLWRKEFNLDFQALAS